MKKISLLLMGIVFFTALKGFSQSKLCVCFEEGNPYIDIRFNGDLTRTDSSIVKPNYETESSREEALEEYRKRALETVLGPGLAPY